MPTNASANMHRFIDYFLVIGADETRKKSSNTNGKILCKLPDKDWEDSPLSEDNLALFCQPLGWKLSVNPQAPTFFISVLTNIKADRHYCACLTFWEPLTEFPSKANSRCDDDDLDCDSMLQQTNYYAPKCLVLVSRFHYVDILRNCLSIIYAVYADQIDVSLETIIGNLLACVEVPLPGNKELEFSLGAGDLQYLQSAINPSVPHTGQIVYDLFEQIGIHALITLFVAVLSEHKVLFHSHSFTRLHDACEALQALMYPFRFCHVYIPLLPSSLIEALAIPTPFLIGCHSALKNEFEDLLIDTIVVDLDCGWLQLPPECKEQPTSLPKLDSHSYNQLVAQLCSVVKPQSVHADQLFLATANSLTSSPPHLLDKEIRAIFLRFLTQTLQGYRNFLQVVRIFPQPYISFHKSLFLGTRALVGNEFVVRLLDSMIFSTFIQERGSPYRNVDLFDTLYANLDATLEMEAKNPNQFVANIRKLAEQLLINEFSSNKNNPLVKVLKPSPEGIERSRQAQFPAIDTRIIQEKIENELIKREMTPSTRGEAISPVHKPVPFGEDSRRLLNGEQELMITNSARRLEVLKSCVNAIFENKVADARKTFPAVLRALKSKFARLALAHDLAAHVSTDGGKAVLEREQFDLIVKLMNSALQQDADLLKSSSVSSSELGDCFGLAAALLPLSMSFCRRLATGVFQFAYSCLQEHEIWQRNAFWESSFYADVQKDLIALYSQSEPCTRCERACKCKSPSANEALEVAAKQLQRMKSIDETELAQLLNNEESTVYSQAIHYAYRMVYMRLPLDVAERDRPVKETHASIGSAGDFDTFTEDYESTSEERTQPQGEISASVVRHVQRFIDKIAVETGISEEHLKSLQMLIPSAVALQVETLDSVCNESRKLPPITKAKITVPPLLPGEEITFQGLRAFLLPDGREELLGNSYADAAAPVQSGALIGCVGGPTFLPAEGALFLTNYRLIFRGRPWDPLACDFVITRAFPITTLTKEKRIHLPSQLISSLDQCLHEGLQLRSNCFQLLRVGFDQEVSSDSIEMIRKLINKARAPTNVFHLFTFTSQLAASAQLRLLSLQKQKEKNGTLRGFAKKTLLKTAERTGIHMSKGKRKHKDRPSAFSEQFETLDEHKESIITVNPRSATMGPPPIPPPPVLDGKHQNNGSISTPMHKERDARTLRKLFELSYVKDYQRLGLASLRGLQQLTTSSNSQSGASRTGLLQALVGGNNSTSNSGTSLNRELRISIVNLNYAVSPTYPAFLVLPACISDDSLKKISKCYKLQRFPTIVWRHPQHRTLLLRASQLHGKGVIGLLKTHASANVGSNLAAHPPAQDSSAFEQEKLFRAIVSLTPSPTNISYSSYSASINSLEQSSLGDLCNKDLHKPSKSASSSSMSASFQRAINTLRTSGGKSGLGTISQSMGKQLQKLNAKMLDNADTHSVCSSVTSMSVTSTRPNGSGVGAMSSLGTIPSSEAILRQNASLVIFGEKLLLRSLRIEQLPAGCTFHPLELHEVKQVKTSFKKLLRLCSPSAIGRPDSEQGFLQQLQASEWMIQLQAIMSAACELVHALNVRRCSALLCFEDGMDLVPQISSIAQICLDPYYRTFSGFRTLIEKEWLAFGHRFSHRSNQTAATLTSGFAPIFLQFLDLVHQLLFQFPLAFEFNQYFLKFVAYHYVSGRFRTFLLDNECERAEYGWLYEDLRRVDEEFEYGRDSRLETGATISESNGNACGAQNSGISGDSSTDGRSSRAASISSSGINYIGTSFWDYAEALWAKSAIFFNFSYVPTALVPQDPSLTLRPCCSLIAFRLWDYYTNEELCHGPSYDFEMVSAEKQRREEVEATAAGDAMNHNNPNRRVIVNPLYDSISHFQPNGIEEMLEQIRQLQMELGHPVSGWSHTWDKLEIPMLSTVIAKQNEVDRQISISSQFLRRYNLAAFSQLASVRKSALNGPVKLHKFEKYNYSTPVSCDYCKKLLWDLVKNGMKCSDCGYNSHEKCFEFVAKSKCEPKQSDEEPVSIPVDEEEDDEADSLIEEEEDELYDFDEDSLGDQTGPDDLLCDADRLQEHRMARLVREESTYYKPFIRSNSACFETETHAGLLCKKGALLKGWKQSWFVLDSNKHQLRYYETRESHTCKGFIDLAEVLSVSLLYDGNSFEVKTTRRGYHFMAQNTHLAQEWVEKLQACIQ